MRRNSRPLAASVAALALLASPAAHAYCRTSSCPDVGTAQVCTPAVAGDCGVPLVWKRPCVGWSLQKDASVKVSFAEVEPIVTAAFAAWTSAACPGGGTPAIVVKEAEPTVCALHEYNQDAANANIIAFRDTSWPYAGTANILALTTVTYDLENGEIYDADMELNSFGTDFTIGDTNVDFDLLSIVTHEAGHFLGLAHSTDQSATMFPDYKPHTTNLRDPSADDTAGICAIYPPGTNAGVCDITPRHGFSTLCAADQPPSAGTESGGGCAATGRSSGEGVWATLALAGLAFAAHRARSRRSRRG
jgi:hypothetical protein